MARFELVAPEYNEWDPTRSTYVLVDRKLRLPCLFWPKRNGYWGVNVAESLNDLDREMGELRALVRAMGEERAAGLPSRRPWWKFWGRG